MFALFDIVRLKKENTELGIKTSCCGTIVDVHNNGEAYTVEFFDSEGETIEAALFVDFSLDEIKLA